MATPKIREYKIKLSQQGAQQIQRQVDGIGKSFSSLKTIATAALTGVFAQKIVEIGKLAATSDRLRTSFDNLANQEGANANQLMKQLQESTKGTVSQIELMRNATQAKFLGIDLKNLPTLFEFARRRARDTGQDVEYLVNSIVTGIGRKSPLILDNLGLQMKDIRNEVEQIARETDTWTGRVDENLLSLHLQEAAVRIAQRGIAQAGAETDDMIDASDNLSASLEDLQVTFGKLIAPQLVTFFGQVSDAIEDINNAANSFTFDENSGLFKLFNLLFENFDPLSETFGYIDTFKNKLFDLGAIQPTNLEEINNQIKRLSLEIVNSSNKVEQSVLSARLKELIDLADELSGKNLAAFFSTLSGELFTNFPKVIEFPDIPLRPIAELKTGLNEAAGAAAGLKDEQQKQLDTVNALIAQLKIQTDVSLGEYEKQIELIKLKYDTEIKQAQGAAQVVAALEEAKSLEIKNILLSSLEDSKKAYSEKARLIEETYSKEISGAQSNKEKAQKIEREKTDLLTDTWAKYYETIVKQSEQNLKKIDNLVKESVSSYEKTLNSIKVEPIEIEIVWKDKIEKGTIDFKEQLDLVEELDGALKEIEVPELEVKPEDINGWDIFRDKVDETSNILADSFLKQWQEGESIFKSFGDAFVSMLERMVAELLARAAIFAILNILVPGSGAVLGGFSGFVLGSPQKRQHGGLVEEDQAYIVGEGGPELFIPEQSGIISPTLSGRNTYNITIAVPPGGDIKAFEDFLRYRGGAQAVANTLPELI